MTRKVPPPAELRIGELSARTGVAASALRYYDKERLIRPTRRVGGKRMFATATVARVKMIRFAKQVGFSLGEVRTLLAGFDRDGLPQTWTRMASRKLKTLEADAARIARMQSVLAKALECGCASLQECTANAESL